MMELARHHEALARRSASRPPELTAVNRDGRKVLHKAKGE